MSNQKTLIRCMRLIDFVQEKPRQVYSIMSFLGVSERTVYRYFKAFEEIGWTVVKDEFGKYTIHKREREMSRIDELQRDVLAWAQERDLLHAKNATAQMGKVSEEVEEFFAEVNSGDRHEMKLEFGDVLVTLIILAEQLSINPEECLSMAYEKIKSRKGKTINGQFIKEK